MTALHCETLTRLARQVECLAPSHRDPHRFHECKSEIAHSLRMLANGITPSKDEIGSIDGPVLDRRTHLVPRIGKISPSRSDRISNRGTKRAGCKAN